MIAVALIGLLVGAMLGVRFKVLVLVPVTVIAALATVTVGVNGSKDSGLIIEWAVLVSVCLQLGYILSAWAIARIFSARDSRLQRHWRRRAASIQ
jgi:hypothetical protein